MKHIFIVNPKAGKQDALEVVTQAVKDSKLADDMYEIYVTKGEKDATAYVKERAAGGEELRFYACGGDGTLNEVVSGAVGFDNVSVASFPCGSGNDYIKYYGTKEEFSDITSLINGVECPVDVMKIGDRYSVNVCNFGFDTIVARTASDAIRSGMASDKAYSLGISTALKKGMCNEGTVYADGKKLNDGKFLLCTLSCGKYVGGSFYCAPRSLNDDGFIEVCMFTPISILKFLTIKGVYARGEHLERKRCKKILRYTRAKQVKVKAPVGFAISIDGEILETNDFTVDILQKAVKFVVPAKLAPVKKAEKVAAV